MARPLRKGGPPVKITITTTERMAVTLDTLLETGLYGTSRAEAAERMLSEGLRQAIKEKVLKTTPLEI